MKKLFLILSLLLLNSCGSLISASLTETLFNPSSIASSLIDYGMKKHTGKKISEHALSIVTDKDCEINKNLKTKLNCKKLTKKNEILALSNSSTPSDIILNIHQKYNVTRYVKCSSSLKFCLIAAGEFDIYAARARAKEWDIAAGHAIAEHAGAILTTFSGKKIIYGKKDFANPALLLKRSNNLMK